MYFCFIIIHNKNHYLLFVKYVLGHLVGADAPTFSHTKKTTLMEVKLSKNLNQAIEELQSKIKAVTGKHRSKKYLLQQLVDTGIGIRNSEGDEMCCVFADIFNVELDGVIVSVVFAPQTTNEIGRITEEENAIESDDVTKIQVINALALVGFADYSRPYDEILNREKQTV